MAYRDTYSIRQGKIQLYRRTAEGGSHRSNSWYCSLKIPNKKTIRRSLKTSDKQEAERLSEELWFDLNQRSGRGLSLSAKPFELVARRFLRDLETKVTSEISSQNYSSGQLRNKSLIIEKYLTQYFKDRNLQDITDQDIINYEYWRKNYWTSGEGRLPLKIEYIRDGRKVKRRKLAAEKKEPSWNTVNKELTVLRQIYEFARLSNIIEGREIPTIKNLRKPRNLNERKPGLTEQEVKYLLSKLVKRYQSQTNPKHKRSHKLLIHYIAWMCSTGMRVSEAKNLKISDCTKFEKNGEKYLKVFVHGKGKSRELIALSEAATVLDKLIYFHKENSVLHDWNFSNDMSLFSDQYGKIIGSFANGLNKALENASLIRDAHGKKRSGGAFRKYYITHALLVGKVNYFELAKQTGTSIAVIEKFYAEIDPTERPEMFIFENALSGVYDDNPAKTSK
jgi:integrase